MPHINEIENHEQDPFVELEQVIERHDNLTQQFNAELERFNPVMEIAMAGLQENFDEDTIQDALEPINGGDEFILFLTGDEAYQRELIQRNPAFYAQLVASLRQGIETADPPVDIEKMKQLILQQKEIKEQYSERLKEAVRQEAEAFAQSIDYDRVLEASAQHHHSDGTDPLRAITSDYIHPGKAFAFLKNGDDVPFWMSPFSYYANLHEGMQGFKAENPNLFRTPSAIETSTTTESSPEAIKKQIDEIERSLKEHNDKKRLTHTVEEEDTYYQEYPRSLSLLKYYVDISANPEREFTNHIVPAGLLVAIGKRVQQERERLVEAGVEMKAPTEVDQQELKEAIILLQNTAGLATLLGRFDPEQQKALPAFVANPGLLMDSNGQIRDFILEENPRILIEIAAQARELFEQRGIPIEKIRQLSFSEKDIEEAMESLRSIPPEVQWHMRFSKYPHSKYREVFNAIQVRLQLGRSPLLPEMDLEIVCLAELARVAQEEMRRSIGEASLEYHESSEWITQNKLKVTVDQSIEPNALAVVDEVEVQQILANKVLNHGIPIAGITEIKFVPLQSDVMPPIYLSAEEEQLMKRIYLGQFEETLYHEVFEHITANLRFNEVEEWIELLDSFQQNGDDVMFITSYPRRVALNGDRVLAYKEDFCESGKMYFSSTSSMYQLYVSSPARFDFIMNLVARTLEPQHRQRYIDSIKNIMTEYEQRQNDLKEQFKGTALEEHLGKERIKAATTAHMEQPEEVYIKGSATEIPTYTAGEYIHGEADLYRSNGVIYIYTPTFIRKETP